MTDGTASDGVVDVLVVGAGPTGLLAAGLLARSGISVRIIDKNTSAAKETRAFGVQARSLELFASLGLADAMLDRGLVATGVQVFAEGERVAELSFDDIAPNDTPYGFLLMVSQSEIEAVLVDDLARLGGTVERGTEATALDRDADAVTVHVHDASGSEAAIRARYVIGSDGAHSTVRKALGLSFAGATYPQTFLLADATVRWPLGSDRLSLFMRGSGFAAFLPLRGRDYARVMVVDPTEASSGAPLAQGSSPVELDVVERAFRHSTGLDVTLSDPRWLSRYRVHHRGVDRYRVGRCFVAGDAAHIHSPAGGQGMNTGLQDAANLAWKLAAVIRHGAADALLDSYHDERWPVGQAVLAQTDRMFSAVADPSGWVVALRKVLAPAVAATLTRIAPLRNRAFRFVSQLGIRYEPGRFLAEETSEGASSRWRDGPGPGRRAPDAATGRHRDVFDLLAGYRFHLLALSREPLSREDIDGLSAELAGFVRDCPAPAEAHLVAHSLVGRDERLVQAESARVFDAYGIGPGTPRGLYLIRPDGYVAWRTDSLDVTACRRFVERVFAPGSPGAGRAVRLPPTPEHAR